MSLGKLSSSFNSTREFSQFLELSEVGELYSVSGEKNQMFCAIVSGLSEENCFFKTQTFRLKCAEKWRKGFTVLGFLREERKWEKVRLFDFQIPLECALERKLLNWPNNSKFWHLERQKRQLNLWRSHFLWVERVSQRNMRYQFGENFSSHS